jgi:multicomponent Na+:H+ antiporter subunit D
MSIAQHLPALQVVLPLVTAPLVVVMRQANVAFLLATAAAWAAVAVAIGLWIEVDARGVVSYSIGSWPPPWGIEYRVDHLSAFVLLLVSVIAAVVLPYSRRSIEAEIPPEKHYLFYAMFTLCLAGLLGITITGDAFNVFVFLEIAALSSYVLIALGRDRRALIASYQYLIRGTIGATFFVIGVGLLYLLTGTLNLADMEQRLAEIRDSRPVLTALAFITVGLSLKLALFPLHQWLPNAYAYAPSAVSAFLAATATKVSIYVLVRFYFSVFGESLVFQKLGLPEIMLPLSLPRCSLPRNRNFSDRLKEAPRLFEPRTDRLHHARIVVQLGDRADRDDRASVQSWDCQSRSVPVGRRRGAGPWRGKHGAHGRSGPADACHEFRHRARRPELIGVQIAASSANGT